MQEGAQADATRYTREPGRRRVAQVRVPPDPAIAVTRALLLAALLLLPLHAGAQTGFCDPSFVPAPTCAAYGPPQACSNSPAGAPIACSDDDPCCPGCRPTNHCPGLHGPRCVEWPFVDVNSDGCYDEADGDVALPWPEFDLTCARTQASADPGCVALPDGGMRCQHATLPVWCSVHPTDVSQRWVIEIDTTGLGPLAGLTTPAGLRCIDATSMLKAVGTADRTTFEIRLAGDFRDYAWGGWKNHLPHTRLFLSARNVVLGGYKTANPLDMNQGTQINWDRDVEIDARGCILLGPSDPRSNTVRVNHGRPGMMLMLRARQGLFIDRSWLVTVKRGLARLEACPLAVGGNLRARTKELIACPRCITDGACGDSCQVPANPTLEFPQEVARTCPSGASCEATGNASPLCP